MANRAVTSEHLTRFFQEHYAQALKAQASIDVDPEVVAVLAGVLPYDNGVVKRFVAKYNLLRNCSREEISAILAAFSRFWKSWRAKEGLGAPPHLDRDGVRLRFNDLFQRLYNAKKRNWISGTSKLLWCMYPE